MIRIRFERRDKKKFEYTYRAYKSFNGQGVTVGIHPDKNSRKEGGLTNTQVAIIHEFGDRHNPERSFLRKTLSRRAPARLAINEKFRKDIKAVLRGDKTASQVNAEVGQMMTDAVKKTIRSGVKPANRPSTVKQKGHGLTLRESWQMYNAIDFKAK